MLSADARRAGDVCQPDDLPGQLPPWGHAQATATAAGKGMHLQLQHGCICGLDLLRMAAGQTGFQAAMPITLAKPSCLRGHVAAMVPLASSVGPYVAKTN